MNWDEDEEEEEEAVWEAESGGPLGTCMDGEAISPRDLEYPVLGK